MLFFRHEHTRYAFSGQGCRNGKPGSIKGSFIQKEIFIMRYIKVFAPGTVANLGCGFDVMGLTLDGVGDLLEVGIEEGAGELVIRNRSGKELPAKTRTT